MSVKVCRVCGCTEVNACFTVTAKVERLSESKSILRAISNSVACHWVEDDLCSVCPADAPPTPAEPVRVIEEFELLHVSIDSHPNAFGESIKIIEPRKPQAVHLVCPLGSGNTHHMTPHRDGRTSGGEASHVHLCLYCKKTEEQILSMQR